MSMSDPEADGGPSVALAVLHQTLLGEAVANSPLLAFVADEDMRYVAVSDGVCEALGYTRDEILQLCVSDVAPEPSAPADFAEMIATGFHTGTTNLRTKTGEQLAFAYFASETRVSGIAFYVSVGAVANASTQMNREAG